MPDDHAHDYPSADRPLNAERRPRLTPLLLTLGLVVFIVFIFWLITALTT